MKKRLLALVAFIILAEGCHMTRHIPTSSFLSMFSLERSAKDTAYKGIHNSPGPGGSIGGASGIGGGTIGPRGTKAGLSSFTGFMINEVGENTFKESEFMEGLASQIRKEIEDNHANITGSGGPTSNGFYVDYKDENIKGRITISGSVRGQVYLLKANVEESTKP
jgi:hypothetical protein